MNLNKDPESWARVSAKAVASGSQAQAENVLQMAIDDIATLSEANNRDFESILICAVRYCIGRQSYIVGSCDRWLRERWSSLSVGTRGVILKDIQRELELERLGHRNLGMAIDRDTWAALYRDFSPGGALAVSDAS